METTKITMAGFKTLAKIGTTAWIRTGSTSDFRNLREIACRADGQWFVRYQDRTPFGYRWGAWRATSVPDADRTRFTFRAARLPKVAA